MALNCDQCKDKCHAACCGVVPFDRKFINRHQARRPVIKEIDLGDGNFILETENMVCPFLTADYVCSVYRDRPGVCQLFGNEAQINLTCHFQDKDGRLRSRQERRKIERKLDKFMSAYKRELEKHARSKLGQS